MLAHTSGAWRELALFKLGILRAHASIHRELAKAPPEGPGEQLRLTDSTFRAYLEKDWKKVKLGVNRWPRLLDFFVSSGNGWIVRLERLGPWRRTLVAAARPSEFLCREGSSFTQDWDSIQKSLKACRKKGPRHVPDPPQGATPPPLPPKTRTSPISGLRPEAADRLDNVQSASGELLTSPEEQAAELHKHWQQIFNPKDFDQQRYKDWFHEYRETKGDLLHADEDSWQLSWDLLWSELLHPKLGSSPGPDGIPFEVYRVLADQAFPIFKRVMESLADVESPDPPTWFNESWLFFLPKKPRFLDPRFGAVYGPGDARPISVVNADNRIFAKVFRGSLQPKADEFVDVAQRGFLTGRQLISNVIDMDVEWREAALSSPQSLLALLDIKAAFPSVGQEFLFQFLKDLGVPVWFLGAIKRFYLHNDHWISLHGEQFPGPTLLSGVRQGCPLSPVIFALISDFLLVMLQKRFPGIFVRAFADDTALVLRDVTREHMSRLDDFLSDWRSISALEVNPAKTVLTPINVSCEHLATLCEGTCWTAAKFTENGGKYLGFLLGPQVTASHSFEEVVRKYTRRMHFAGRMGLRHLGQHLTLMHHQAYHESLFGYQFQLYFLPESTHQQLDKLAQSSLGGPGNWLTWAEGRRIGRDWGFRQPPRCRRASNLSLLARTACKEGEDCIRLRDGLIRAGRRMPEDFPMSHLALYRNSFVQTLAESLDEFTRLTGKEAESFSDQPKLSALIYREIKDKFLGLTTERKLDANFKNRWQLGIRNAHCRERCREISRMLGKKSSPRVHWSYFRMLHNAWHTHARYQRALPCAFCHHPESRDSIEHYMRCPVVAQALPEFCSGPRIDRRKFFLLDIKDENRFLGACLLYGLARTGDALRHATIKPKGHIFRMVHSATCSTCFSHLSRSEQETLKARKPGFTSAVGGG